MYRPAFDHFSTRDARAEEVEHGIDSPTVEDDDETLSKESEIDDDQGSEATADETVKEPTPRRKTRSQGKKAFNIPAAASPSDLENEPTPPKRSISRIKARGAVTTRPTEAVMQPSMEACASGWIHQAQDRSWRQYVPR